MIDANTVEYDDGQQVRRIHVALAPGETIDRLGRFLLRENITAAQWNSARAALIKRAKNESMTAQEETLADRGQALAAAFFFDAVTPTDMG